MISPPETRADIRDPGLADAGDRRIAWALQDMPVLQTLARRFGAQRSLQGVRISGCLHITTETGKLALTLKTAGADLVSAIHKSRPQLIDDMLGGTGETTTGVIRHARQGGAAPASSSPRSSRCARWKQPAGRHRRRSGAPETGRHGH